VGHHPERWAAIGVHVRLPGNQCAPPRFLNEDAICGCGLEERDQLKITTVHIYGKDVESGAPHCVWRGVCGCITHDEKDVIVAISSVDSRERHISSVLAPCWWSVTSAVDLFSRTRVNGPEVPGVGGRVSASEGPWASGTRMSLSELGWFGKERLGSGAMTR
jgi:hypothetical protein